MKLHNNSQTSLHKPSQLYGIYWFKNNLHINIQRTVVLKQTCPAAACTLYHYIGLISYRGS